MKESTPKKYPDHPFSEIFPLHEGPPLWELADDIKANGLIEPIVLAEQDGREKVLDGRRRELACIRAGVEPTYTRLKGTDEQKLAYVVSKNLHRRHLGEYERGLAAKKIATFKKGGDRKSEDFKGSIDPLKTIAEASEMMDISTGTTKRVATIDAKGTPELKAAAAAGEVSISDAAAAATQPKKRQRKALKAVETGEAKTLKEAIESNGDAHLLDSAGHVVPDFAIEAFKAVEKFDELISLCQKLQKGIDELANMPGGEQLARMVKATQSTGGIIHKNENLNALKRDLKGTRPHSVCPWCKGEGNRDCNGCTGHLWVSKITWDQSEESIKARLA